LFIANPATIYTPALNGNLFDNNLQFNFSAGTELKAAYSQVTDHNNYNDQVSVYKLRSRDSERLEGYSYYTCFTGQISISTAMVFCTSVRSFLNCTAGETPTVVVY